MTKAEPKPKSVDRRTVDLDAYPDLVMILLGMKVTAWRGLATLFGIGPGIQGAAAAAPDGLLHHEFFVFSLIPPHVGIRQYWRDFQSLEAWTRSEPHARWWRDFLRDSGGTGFWHETYFRRGGVEAIYDDTGPAPGLGRFAPLVPARGSLFSARRRAGLAGDPPPPPVADGV